MFGAAVYKTTSWWQNLAFNWFDLALVVILMFGYFRGRKRGMSREFLPVLFWISVVVACSFGYQIIGDQLLSGSLVKKVYGKNFTGRTAVFIWSYLLIMFVIYIIFAVFNRMFKAKLEGSSAFGSSEYYLGMIAGIIRYACILIVALALLNAPYYSAQEIAASKAYKLNTYAAGGNVRGLENDTGDFIPDLSEVQDSVFRASFSGPLIKDHLSFILINSTAPVKKSHSAGQH